MRMMAAALLGLSFSPREVGVRIWGQDGGQGAKTGARTSASRLARITLLALTVGEGGESWGNVAPMIVG